MPILPNEKKALRELQENLRNNYSLVDFKLYGSKSKGTDQPESDLDVVLEIISKEHLTGMAAFHIKLQCFRD